MKRLVVAGGALLALLLLFYVACLHFSGVTEVGITRNWISGELKLDTPGWNVSPPWVSVAKVDARPARVCVTSASRAFNCKLVQFVPNEFRLFVQTEGFRYYWWYNRISFNGGYGDEYRGMKDVLRGYAYSSKQYPFVVVLRDYEFGE